MKPNSIMPGFVRMLAHEALIVAQIADKKDQARWVATHAQQALIALNHVQMAEEVKSDQHIKAAEHALNEAIKHGNMGRTDLAARSAEKAVKHLEMASSG